MPFSRDRLTTSFQDRTYRGAAKWEPWPPWYNRVKFNYKCYIYVMKYETISSRERCNVWNFLWWWWYLEGISAHVARLRGTGRTECFAVFIPCWQCIKCRSVSSFLSVGCHADIALHIYPFSHARVTQKHTQAHIPLILHSYERTLAHSSSHKYTQTRMRICPHIHTCRHTSNTKTIQTTDSHSLTWWIHSLICNFTSVDFTGKKTYGRYMLSTRNSRI